MKKVSKVSMVTGEVTNVPRPWYNTQAHYDYRETYNTRVRPVSVTDPSQALTVQQILDRHVRNIAVPRNAVENVPADLSMYDKMDRIERMQAARVLATRVKVVRDLLDSEAAKKAEGERLKKFNDEVDAKVKEHLRGLTPPDAV